MVFAIFLNFGWKVAHQSAKFIIHMLFCFFWHPSCLLGSNNSGDIFHFIIQLKILASSAIYTKFPWKKKMKPIVSIVDSCMKCCRLDTKNSFYSNLFERRCEVNVIESKGIRAIFPSPQCSRRVTKVKIDTFR